MKWKVIGQSVAGTSHQQVNKPCEDALAYAVVTSPQGEDVLICCVADGAGSARHAAIASALVTTRTVDYLSETIVNNTNIHEPDIVAVAEKSYDELQTMAAKYKEPLNEFSCTYLGCILFNNKSIFFQIGDGAMVRDDGNNHYVPVWWPENGEYSNITFFLVDDYHFSHLKTITIEESVQEVALFTDGLQLLALNNENFSAHQPFFNSMFKWLRMATKKEDVDILNRKLNEYLNSNAINNRTDDDKTLLLATRMSYG